MFAFAANTILGKQHHHQIRLWCFGILGFTLMLLLLYHRTHTFTSQQQQQRFLLLLHLTPEPEVSSLFPSQVTFSFLFFFLNDGEMSLNSFVKFVAAKLFYSLFSCFYVFVCRWIINTRPKRKKN